MCDDFVWDPTLEELRMRKCGTGSFSCEFKQWDEFNASALETPSMHLLTYFLSARKRKHDELFTESAKEDPRFISTNTTEAPCRASGLRGIYNMGATCYMNVILQCFVHNPLLRNFYLGDGHQNADCSIKNCMSCAMDDMFQDFYGQEITTGYSAANILASFWLSKRKAYEELASNKEQDAHEFFQFLTEELHEINGGGRLLATEDNQGVKRSKTNHESGCKCIVHQTFYGKSQSTVTCQNCGDINVSVQPFLDLSLGLDSISKKKHLQSTMTLSLQGCLDEEYAKTERCEYTCHGCGNLEAKKSLSIKSLPNVLCIQLKVGIPVSR
jgi:ubiquitin carboxyl-terminal hydrolase 22/27/51